MEFTLIDLRTQMPFLPCALRRWPRERFLAWLRVYGEVIDLHAWDNAHTIKFPFAPESDDDRLLFISWCGVETHFMYREYQRLHIPSTATHAWDRCS